MVREKSFDHFLTGIHHGKLSQFPALLVVFPAGQSSQIAMEAARYLPITHSEQVRLPVGLKLLIGQTVQMSPSNGSHRKQLLPSRINPALHVQSVLPLTEVESDQHVWHVDTETALYAELYVPALQFRQALGPVTSLYFPRVQALQYVVLEEVPISNPLLQRHDANSIDVEIDVESGGQYLQLAL
jgi:hypothetical protein